MKVLAILMTFSTLALLAAAQAEDTECPEELRSAFHSVKGVCKPVLMKHFKKAGGPAESRRKRQNDDVEECLTKIKEQTAFEALIEGCTSEGEEQLTCFMEEFKKVCPPPAHHHHKPTD